MRMTSLNLASGHNCPPMLHLAPHKGSCKVSRIPGEPLVRRQLRAIRFLFFLGLLPNSVTLYQQQLTQVQHKSEMEKTSIWDLLSTPGTKLHSDRTLFRLI